MGHDGETPKFDHILVPRAALPVDAALSFDLFVKVAGRFIKVANRDEKIDVERLNRYLEHERDVLYIDRGSLERFMDEKFGLMFEMISTPSLPFQERSEWFVRCLELGFIDLKVVRPHSDKFMRIEMLINWSFDFFRKRETRKILVKAIFHSLDQPISRPELSAVFFSAHSFAISRSHMKAEIHIKNHSANLKARQNSRSSKATRWLRWRFCEVSTSSTTSFGRWSNSTRSCRAGTGFHAV
jgi:hypothetical protein